MPAMTDLFNLTGLAKPLTWEEGLRILERDRFCAIGKNEDTVPGGWHRNRTPENDTWLKDGMDWGR